MGVCGAERAGSPQILMSGDPIDSAPIIDVRNNGLGDVVVACWIVHSALAIDRLVRVNTYRRRDAAVLFGVPAECLTFIEPVHSPLMPGLGDLEYRLANTTPISRFDAWCESLSLPRIDPVRPPYLEAAADGDWADRQWCTVDPTGEKTRVLIFPEAAWSTRMWPQAYFIDVANELASLGYAVATMAETQKAVEQMPCHWWGGFSVRQGAAMCKRAHLVVANDSGPAHLASVLGTRTIAICGPTEPAVVFAHEPNVHAVRIERDTLSCVGCHFSGNRGYRHACDAGGCQALMRLDPVTVASQIRGALVSVRHSLAGSSL